MAEQPGFTACKGLYCSECYGALNNTCSVCTAPPSSPDSGDEEMDSSDEDTPGLWPGRGQERGRRLLQHIKDVLKPSRTAAQL